MPEKIDFNSNDGERLIIHWRAHPVQAAKDILNVTLDRHQRIVLQQMWFNADQYNILSRGCGKCIAGNSMVATSAGMWRLDELGPMGDPATLADQQGTPVSVRSLDLTVAGPQGTPVRATHWYDNNESPGIRITSKFGYVTEGTAQHRVVLWKDGRRVETALADVRVGDTLLVQRFGGLFGSSVLLPSFVANTKHVTVCATLKFPTQMTEDLAYWLGLCSGDGTCGYEKFVGFTSGDDQLRWSFSRLALQLFNWLSMTPRNPGRTNSCRLNGLNIRRFLVSIGMDLDGAHEKRIPWSIRVAPRPMVVAYLQGLFDTDGGCDKRGIVSYGSSSYALVHEVHAMLANLGVIGDLRYKPKVDAWEIDITGSAADTFMSTVGFRCKRKIEAYRRGSPKVRNPNADVLRGCGRLFAELRDACKARGIVISRRLKDHQKLYSYIADTYSPGWESVRRILNELQELRDEPAYQQLHDLCNSRPFFDLVESTEAANGHYYDLVVPDGHLFVANSVIQHNTFLNAVDAVLEAILKPNYRVGIVGPSYRQSQLVWDEIEKLYVQSPAFQQAVDKEPVRRPEKCYLRLKAAWGRVGSVIEALPMGNNGGKIRGARYFTTIADEATQIDKETLDIVVRGFGTTSHNPMERVAAMAEQRELVRQGILTEDQIVKPPSNRFIFSTTAYYQYNHGWERISKIIEDVTHGFRNAQRAGQDTSNFTIRGEPLNEGQTPHRIISDGKIGMCAFTCYDPSEGFIDMARIDRARREMSDYQFRMEYLAYWPPDSEGFFRRSTLDACRNHIEFGPVLGARRGYIYALGADPARDGDNFSVAIFEIDVENDAIRLVRVVSWNKTNFPQAHRHMRRLINEYDIEYFQLDAGGGGTTIRDLFASKENCPAGERLILEQGFDEHKTLVGDRILGPLCQFSNGQWVHDANHNLLSGLQHGKLRIAAKPPLPGQIWTPGDEEANEEIEKALSEWSTIIVTNIGSRQHWDTPTKSMRKDRYSAILIGYDAALKALAKHKRPRTLVGGFWR